MGLDNLEKGLQIDLTQANPTANPLENLVQNAVDLLKEKGLPNEPEEERKEE